MTADTDSLRAMLDALDQAHAAWMRGAPVPAAFISDVPDLVAKLRAVLDLADELEEEAQRQANAYPADSNALPAVVGRSWVNASRQFRAAVTGAGQ